MKTQTSRLDEILTKGNILDLIHAIRNRELDSQLPKLKDHENERVRRVIAFFGLYLPKYINDPSAIVREAVIMTEASYVKIMLENYNQNDDDALIRWITKDTTKDRELWNTIFARPEFITKLKKHLTGGEYALNIVKQMWENEKQDAIAKTMTRTQLYQANNPFWAYEYCLGQIDIFANKHTDNKDVLDRCFAIADKYYR